MVWTHTPTSSFGHVKFKPSVHILILHIHMTVHSPVSIAEHQVNKLFFLKSPGPNLDHHSSAGGAEDPIRLHLPLTSLNSKRISGRIVRFVDYIKGLEM